MSATSARWRRLTPGLSAQERALLLVRGYKEDRRPDAHLRATTPEQQWPEVSRLLGLARAVNWRLAGLVVLYQEQVAHHHTQLAWLATLKLWGDGARDISLALTFTAEEAITESDHRRRLAEALAEEMTLAEAAGYLVARREEEPEDDHDWERAERQELSRLKQAVRDGQLLAGKGTVCAGDLWDWLGVEGEAHPEHGLALRVVPDDQAERAERQRCWHGVAQEALARAPVRFAGGEKPGHAPAPSERMAYLAERDFLARLGRTWLDVAALERAIGEVAEELGGEDPMHPELRGLLAKLRADLDRVVAMAQEALGIELEMPEPGEEEMGIVYGVIEAGLSE